MYEDHETEKELDEALLAEQVLGEIYLAVGGHRKIVHVEGRNLEHLIGAFAVRAGDQRGVHVKISVALEVLVDRHCCNAADAEDRAEQVCSGTQVCNGAKELSGVALGLDGIVLRAIAKERNACCLQLKGLLIFGGEHQRADHLNACPNSYLGDGVKIIKSILVNDLEIFEKGTVIYVQESKL